MEFILEIICHCIEGIFGEWAAGFFLHFVAGCYLLVTALNFFLG